MKRFAIYIQDYELEVNLNEEVLWSDTDSFPVTVLVFRKERQNGITLLGGKQLEWDLDSFKQLQKILQRTSEGDYILLVLKKSQRLGIPDYYWAFLKNKLQAEYLPKDSVSNWAMLIQRLRNPTDRRPHQGRANTTIASFHVLPSRFRESVPQYKELFPLGKDLGSWDYDFRKYARWISLSESNSQDGLLLEKNL